VATRDVGRNATRKCLTIGSSLIFDLLAAPAGLVRSA
jgi:hypothetical protein